MKPYRWAAPGDDEWIGAAVAYDLRRSKAPITEQSFSQAEPVATEAPLEVVVWTNEEGSRFAPAMIASGVYAGLFEKDFAWAITDGDGKSLGDELQRIGYKSRWFVVTTRSAHCWKHISSRARFWRQITTRSGLSLAARASTGMT